MISRRWDTDERGHGVADARASMAAIHKLAELAGSEDWVAEDPETHLLPGLRERLEHSSLSLLRSEVEDDGTFRIRLGSATGLSRREIRQAVWSVLGGVAELSTLVEESVSGDTVRFEVVTGIPPGGRFATHGHRLLIELDAP